MFKVGNLICYEKWAMEYWSRMDPGTVVLKNINFKDMVIRDYKGYGNELLSIASTLPWGAWVQILSVYNQ